MFFSYRTIGHCSFVFDLPHLSPSRVATADFAFVRGLEQFLPSEVSTEDFFHPTIDRIKEVFDLFEDAGVFDDVFPSAPMTKALGDGLFELRFFWQIAPAFVDFVFPDPVLILCGLG